jgi:transcriptional regulator with XRE-family HTH domain
MAKPAASRESCVHARSVLASTLVSARLVSGLTQTELGKEIGRDQTFISKVEGQERRLGVIEFVQITDALRTDPLIILSAVSNALRQEN